MSKGERLEGHITPLTVIELQYLLNWLKENGEYMAQIDNVIMKYKGIVEDTINGKREMFYKITIAKISFVCNYYHKFLVSIYC